MSKIIISDTSCLIALFNVGLLHILKDLFDVIIITPEIKEEFGQSLPNWIIIKQVKNIEKQSQIEALLDKGESSAIALALETENAFLIIDEIKGRKVAKSYEIDIIGTIGILVLANKKGLIKDLPAVISKLIDNGFRLSEKLLQKLLG
jgi:predicted nucleic acid-binding protein